MRLLMKVLITILLVIAVAYFTDRMHLIYKGVDWITDSLKDLRIHIMAFLNK